MRVLQGRRRQAAAAYAEALQMLAQLGELLSFAGAAAYYVGQGEWLREHNALDEAERHLIQAADLMRGLVTVDADTILFGALALARLRQARGDAAGALAALDVFEQVTQRHAVAPSLLAQATAARAWLRLAQGDLAAAVEWIETARLPLDDISFPCELQYTTLARVLIAQRRAGPALKVLDRLLRAAEAGGRMGSAIGILALQALAFVVHHDRAAALAALGRALTLAEPEGYVRVFTDEGAPMAELLHEALARRIMPGYVEKLLAAFPDNLKIENVKLRKSATQTGQSQSQFSIFNSQFEALSERELEVLRLVAALQPGDRRYADHRGWDG
jgi:LuxR family maltose regulon positive regulatory protein